MKTLTLSLLILLCLGPLGSAIGADAKEALVQTSENGLFKVEMTLQGDKFKLGRIRPIFSYGTRTEW
jgi:hypothetical protein